MKESTVGDILREARLSQDLTLREMEEKTTIRSRYLLALEYNDFDSLPEKAQVSHFLEKYARALLLDPEPIIYAYDTDTLVPYEEIDLDAEKVDLVRSNRMRKRRRQVLLVTLVTVLVLIFGMITAYRLFGSSAKKGIQTFVNQHVIKKEEQKTKTTTQKTKTSTKKENADKEANLSVQGSGSALNVTVSNLSQTDAVTVELSVADGAESWVSVSNSDLASGTTLSSDNSTVKATLVDGATNATINIGSTTGLSMKINGKKVDLSSLTTIVGNVNLTIEKGENE